MNNLFATTLQQLEHLHAEFVALVPSPVKVPARGHFVFRYAEKTPCQALVLKLARNVTGLSAAHTLCRAGLFQEQACIQRILDEVHEDITFLSLGEIFGTTELHERFLSAFWEEEFDQPDDPLASTQKRPMIPRQKIHAYIANHEASPANPSRAIELARTLTKTYSGFVHAASTQVMDLYGGYPPRFHVSGQSGTPWEQTCARDLCNYFYRGIMAFGYARLAFHQVPNDPLMARIETLAANFAQRAGMNPRNPPPSEFLSTPYDRCQP